MRVPLYVICCIFLTDFNILFIFCFYIFISMYLGIFLLGLIQYGTLCTQVVFFPRLNKFSTIMSLNTFASHLSLSFLSETTMMQIFVSLMSSRCLLHYLHFFFPFFSSCFFSELVISTTLSSTSLIFCIYQFANNFFQCIKKKIQLMYSSVLFGSFFF